MKRALASAGAASVLLFPSPAHAQLLAALAPAPCGTPSQPRVTASAVDSSLITGTVVRLAAGKSDKDIDQFLSHAMSKAISSHLQRYVEAPVQSRAEGQRRSASDDEREAAAAAIAEGRIYGVQWVVSGTVERRRDTSTVTWRVHDTRTGQQRSSGMLRAPVTLLDSIAHHIARTVAPEIGNQRANTRSVTTARATSTTAFDLLIEGLYRIDSFDPASWQKGEDVLAKAVAADPELLVAWQALAEVRINMLHWGGSRIERQFARRASEAVSTAHRALALDNRDTRTLALVARAHLLRDELTPAAQAIDGIRSIDPNSPLLPALDIEAALLSGDTGRLAALHGAMDYRLMRDPLALYSRAEWHRRNRRDAEACRTLNRVLSLEPGWAPAVAMRAVVRARLGDRRGAWIDAEVATRLGRPEWGTPIAALTDVAAADMTRARERMRGVSAPTRPGAATYMQSLLNGAALLAVRQPERANAFLAATVCADPLRRLLVGDPLLQGVTPTECRA